MHESAFVTPPRVERTPALGQNIEYRCCRHCHHRLVCEPPHNSNAVTVAAQPFVTVRNQPRGRSTATVRQQKAAGTALFALTNQPEERRDGRPLYHHATFMRQLVPRRRIAYTVKSSRRTSARGARGPGAGPSEVAAPALPRTDKVSSEEAKASHSSRAPPWKSRGEVGITRI